MNTDQLKIIIDLISKLGDGARSTFLWYIAYSFTTDLVICATWVAVPVLTVKAVFKGMKDNNT